MSCPSPCRQSRCFEASEDRIPNDKSHYRTFTCGNSLHLPVTHPPQHLVLDFQPANTSKKPYRKPVTSLISPTGRLHSGRNLKVLCCKCTIIAPKKEQEQEEK